MLHLVFVGVVLVFWVSLYGCGAMVDFLIHTKCMLKYQEPVVLSNIVLYFIKIFSG